MPGGRPRIHPKPGSNRAWVDYLVPWDREGNLLRCARALPRDQVVWKANATFKATLRPVAVRFTEYTYGERTSVRLNWYEWRDWHGRMFPMFREHADELMALHLSGRPSIYATWDVNKKAPGDGISFFGVRLVAIL